MGGKKIKTKPRKQTKTNRKKKLPTESQEGMVTADFTLM